MFEGVKEGDKLTRMLGGTIPMEMIVEKVHEGLIFCVGGWTFDAATGAEVDPDLGWGPPPLHTGSLLTAINGEQIVSLSKPGDSR